MATNKEISPFTGGPIEIRTKDVTFNFRGESFTCKRRYYVCLDTGHEYTDDKLDDELFWQIIDLYRVKHPEAKNLPKKG
jgi:hypothetical protein